MLRNHEKVFFFAAALVVSGLLVGCNQLTQYTISEQEINQALEKRNNFSKDIGLPGIADAHIVLTNLASQIGREEPNKVTLTGDAGLDMNSLFGSQKATMKLKLKALPVFDKEKGAIYLQEMEVVDATVTPEKMQSVLQTLLPYLNQSLRSYFNQRPAYVLREDSSKGEALAKKLAKGIEVKLVKSLFLSPIDFGGRARALFTCKRKRFRLSFVSGKKTIPQPELINDCTILCFKDPPPGRLARSPSRWRHVKNGRTLYQRNLWSRYRDAEHGVPHHDR